MGIHRTVAMVPTVEKVVPVSMIEDVIDTTVDAFGIPPSHGGFTCREERHPDQGDDTGGTSM